MYADRRCRVHTEILFLFQVLLKICIQLVMFHFYGSDLIFTALIAFKSKFLSRETKFSSSWREIRVIRVRDSRVKMTEKWGQIQGKCYFVRVSGGIRVIRVRVTGVLP